MIKAFTGTMRNTNAVESYFGSMKYYEDKFHYGYGDDLSDADLVDGDDDDDGWGDL